VFLSPVLAVGARRTPDGCRPQPQVRGHGQTGSTSCAPHLDGTKVNWLVKATRKGVDFPVEPLRSDVKVRGAGPYRYLVA
jgi:hypothetical protein